MTLTEIAAAEARIQSVCKVTRVVRQEDPRPMRARTIKIVCVVCSKPFWRAVYRVKGNTKYCSKKCADSRRSR